MEGEEQIGFVLSRASELTSKLNSCITHAAEEREEDEEEEEKESLVGVRDALASLEQQLASLQTLQQQQLYERESALAQIDRGRMILLSKLKEYKGEDLEVIHEAAAFAGETIEWDDDLLLPPYPRHLSDTLVLDDLYSSNFASKPKISHNGLSGISSKEIKNSVDESGNKQEDTISGNRWKGLRPAVMQIAKSALAVVSILTAMSYAGFDVKSVKSNAHLNLSGIYQKPVDDDKQKVIECPPGKFLVMENGEARCVVKERVEIPFDPEVKAPNLSYGLG